MQSKSHYPKKLKELGILRERITDEEISSCLRRFKYRFRLAKSFELIVAPTLDKRTIYGYSAVMKVLLAYSAFDEIRWAKSRILNIKGAIHYIENEKLANKLRSEKLDNLKNALINSTALKDKALKKDLNDFYEPEPKHNDVMCIATVLRNSFAHGVFTAGGASLNTKREANVVFELAECLLDKTEEMLDEILAKY